MPRVAFVTGAGRGIGAAIARRLGRDGLAVAATDLDGASAETVASDIEVAGGVALGLAADITDIASIEAAVSATEAVLGPVDVLVNNAGWDKLEPFLSNTPELWDRLLSINLRGPINVSHVVATRMTARAVGGRIVNVSSDAGRVGSMGETVYAACKAGVIGFTKSLARELAGQGVTVNAVCPGPTETALLDDVRSTERGRKIMQAVGRSIPLGRFGVPEDIANAVSFFAADDAAYVTGQILSVSGGLTMVG